MTNYEWKQPITAHRSPACPHYRINARVPVRKTKFGIDWAKVENNTKDFLLGALIAAVPVAFLVLWCLWWMCVI